MKNQLSSMKTVYEKWGLPFEGTAYQKRLAAEEVRRASSLSFAMIFVTGIDCHYVVSAVRHLCI